MEKIKSFLKKWGNVILGLIIVVMLLFALSCCIFTAISNTFVGIVGAIAIIAVITPLIIWIIKKIKLNGNNK